MILLLAAALSCLTPQGHRLTLTSQSFPDAGSLSIAQGTPYAQGFRYVADHPGIWWKVALEADRGVLWPDGQTLLAWSGGKPYPALDLFAMSPPLEQTPVRLGKWAVTLDPKDLDSARWKGRLAIKLFVRFAVEPDSISIGKEVRP